MLHLVTFGGLALESVNEAVAPRLSAQRLALLAVLAAEGDRRVSRERLTGLFWPDADEERARHSLRQALYTLRQEVGRDVIRSDFVLSLDASVITADIVAFRAALARGDREVAAQLARGPFLDGFYLPGAAPFQRWVEEERARLHSASAAAIASLAADASSAKELDAAVRWWRRLTELDPLSGRFAVGYLKALAARGDRADALAFARAHTALVRRELETDADEEVRRVEASLRAMPAVADGRAVPGVRPDADAESRDDNDPPAPATTPSTVGVPQRVSTRRLTRPAVAFALVAGAVALAVVVGWPGLQRARASATIPAVAAVPADVGTRSVTAYRLYQEGVHSYHANDREAAANLMRAALRDDSMFAMAAYYNAIATDDGVNFDLERRALRLAATARERDRLLITTEILNRMLNPAALAFADSLGARYPADPSALEVVARVRQVVGDWPGAVRSLERAVAIDSASPDPRSPCHLCDHLEGLANAYFWADSISAAQRVGQRFVRLMPESPRGWDILAWSAVKLGDSAAATLALRRATELFPAHRSAPMEVRYKLLMDQYATTMGDLRPLLESPKLNDVGDARWWMSIALRNQGRLGDAWMFNETARLPGLAVPLVQPPVPDEINRALISLERGTPKVAVAAFGRQKQRMRLAEWPEGFIARSVAWNGALTGMAYAAAGDTLAILRWADTVEYWGKRSLYGRDTRLHHYLRGMVHVAGGRDDQAIDELRQAIFSATLGFTRVNFELGRALMRRGRASEAVAVVAPALRGEIDSSNLYVTRTELHELLAQAFDRAGMPDSAAKHYRAVASAWANADPEFHARRDAARAWLARH
ncbi:MAG TPA: BTAD domain-containing putative transcriptional regulator [Gemmatimonadaceae bacterium]|nr:BTAD domain-containing putative transcriptional regulator [Gemmatimonadaceae bacterium]